VDEIRKLMFVFEDIINLDPQGMQMLVRSLENSDIGVALKSASEELKEQFFANMSKRVAEQMKEDMEYMRNVRGRDVEAAQQRIVAKVRELEERGELVVGRGGEDDYV
jgi:flagellar motor switch protein FliG